MPMKTISDLAGIETAIVQPSFFRRAYELRAGTELIATMNYPRFFSSFAEIDVLQQQWEIYKPSIWKNMFEVRQRGYQMPTAKYTGERWKQGGIIELPLGQRLKHIQKIWTNMNGIATETGTLLVTFKRKGFFGTAVAVDVHEKSELLDKHPWVIMLVWYVLLQQRRDAATH